MLLMLGLLATAATGATSIEPSSVGAPQFAVGDAWLFQDGHERGTANFQQKDVDVRIERVAIDTMIVGIKPHGAPTDFEAHMLGLDWSPRRLVGGRQTPQGRPLSFPLVAGKTWTADYDNPNRYGRQVSAHFHETYRVTGWKDVTTPAGAFHVVEIQGDGLVDAKLEPAAGAVGGVVVGPSGSTTFTHAETAGPTETHATTVSTFDYAPQVKAVVKSVEEEFDADGIRTSRDTRELMKFTPAG